MEDINVSVYIEDMSEGNDYKYSLSEGSECWNGYNGVNLTIDYPLGVSVS